MTSVEFTPEHAPWVRMRGIGKRFGHVQVLDDVQLELHPGEVHILAGENGAGKSTLIKILAGVHADWDGTIEIGGRAVRPRTPQEASALGIGIIHQELSLIPAMSVADNIFLGRNLTRCGFVSDQEQRRGVRKILGRIGLESLDPLALVETLPIGVQQLVEIAKALNQAARVLIMDEPTSALNAAETARLFELIQDLKKQGCCIVYITHKMEEIEKIADRITVLRDGRYVGSAGAGDLSLDTLVEWMVGRRIEQQFPPRATHIGNELLRLEKFSVYPNGFHRAPTAQDIDLTVRAGEILGIGGLQGSGSSDLLHGMFGSFGGYTRGNVTIAGQPVRIADPRAAIANGMALLTNDRQGTGLVLDLPIIANATLAALPRLSPGGWRNPTRERAVTTSLAKQLNLRANRLDMPVRELSGGNQQKVAFAKWLATAPRILLLDEPTRGIDVGAKREIYELLARCSAEGMGIILITSEMPELLAISDRIIVLHRGRLMAEMSREQANAEVVLKAAMGSQLSREAMA